jgi:hypothetical protein
MPNIGERKRISSKVGCKGAHTRSIMLRKIVLRNKSLTIHDQVNQHHTRSTSCTTRNVAQHD